MNSVSRPTAGRRRVPRVAISLAELCVVSGLAVLVAGLLASLLHASRGWGERAFEAVLATVAARVADSIRDDLNGLVPASLGASCIVTGPGSFSFDRVVTTGRDRRRQERIEYAWKADKAKGRAALTRNGRPLPGAVLSDLKVEMCPVGDRGLLLVEFIVWSCGRSPRPGSGRRFSMVFLCGEGGRS